MIEKYWKSDSRSKNKVVIRYYEHENGLSPIFKLDTIKVELFFRNKNHFNLKVDYFRSDLTHNIYLSCCLASNYKDYGAHIRRATL